MKYEYWLAQMEGISEKKKRALRKELGSAKAVYNIEEKNICEFPFINENERKKILSAKKFHLKKSMRR